MDSLPIVLPAAPAAPRRAPLPFMAALVPVATGVVLWLVTGSLLALGFAALGPLMIGASLVDSARARRRERRRGEQQVDEEWAAAEAELVRRHQDEREELWQRWPDCANAIAQPPLRGAQQADATIPVVVGAGGSTSEVRCSGGDDPRGREFRARCHVVEDAPIVVPIGGGICLRGPRPLIEAAARALILQLCLRFPRAQLSLVGTDPEGTVLADQGLASVPHTRRAGRGGFRIGLGPDAGDRRAADAMIWLAAESEEVPEGITTVIDIVEPRQAMLRTPAGTTAIAVECLSQAQAHALATELALRDDETDVLPDAVRLSELEQTPSHDGLAAAIGRGERGSITVDIVEDGPHAIVTGMTGTGKSELLVSWVTAIATAYGPDRVTFVLADFKGGTAFEPLRALRQVVAVITDLDDEGARRGVSSLTAELRRREGALAAAGARDVRDVSMPRLVIVVDEFAALLAEHPDLGAVFTDIAARGRALGMHLILGTQRATGVIRDALAANCPLRVSLRVGDTADSRLVIGTDAAAALTGDAGSRGLGLVRRPTDHEPVAVRIALTEAADLRDVGSRWAAAGAPSSPWLPPLPAVLPIAEVVDHTGLVSGAVILGRADDPGRQEQPLELLRCGEERGLVVLGAPGSGRTSVLRAVAAQRNDAFWMPSDPEGLWDLLTSWAEGAERPPAVVLGDDVEGALAALPPEYAQQLVHRWERALRAAQGSTFVLTATRVSGALGRVLDLLPRRALLRMSTRLEHLAAGGDASGFVRDRVPGRAVIGDREVQMAWVDDAGWRRAAASRAPAWMPSSVVTAVVSAAPDTVIAAMRDAHPACAVMAAGIDPTAPGGRCIMVADAETWQRNWSVWQRIRSSGEVLVRCENPGDLRQLVGARELPPYARPHAGRAWSVIGAGAPRRVHLAELAPR
ncbi:FtsK/SpoIIIE domain-containing protein [Microbacterium sp. NPDC091662]|uniref:FtsK/SpoIIIE domain-containing protein n=1 Tax=Microbacterium sp. NPDC091662 TaxID=3364211 RepID=UPI00381CF8AC